MTSKKHSEDPIVGALDPLIQGTAGAAEPTHAEAEHVAGGAAPDAAADSAALVEIAALAAALAAEKDKRLREMADFENSKKRLVRERQEAEMMGMRVMARGLLDALDDLGRFAHLDPAGIDAKTVVDGAAMVEKKIIKSLSGHGLEVLNPVDGVFDPAFHEALTAVPVDAKDEDHLVAQVYQVGYLFNGQLLRPARVVVKQWRGESGAT